MELITYLEAVDILGGKIDTIRHAVSRGDLSRAGRQKRNTYLIKEQVLLFKGKKISHESLNSRDKEIWQRYEQEIAPSAAIINEETMRRIAREENKSQDLVKMLEAIEAFIRGGIPQGDFFQEHPIWASIAHYLFVAVSIIRAVQIYDALDEIEQKEVLAYLSVIDASLEVQEKSVDPPITIEEIRQRRQHIIQFKQKVAA